MKAKLKLALLKSLLVSAMILLWHSGVGADHSNRHSIAQMYLGGLEGDLDHCRNSNVPRQPVDECERIYEDWMPNVPEFRNLAQKIGPRLYHYIDAAGRGTCISVAAFSNAHAHGAREYPAISQRSMEIANQALAIGAAKVAAACGGCPPEEIWTSKTGQDLSKSASLANSKAWDQFTKQCRPEPEQAEDASEPKPVDDCDMQLPIQDKRIEIDGEIVSCLVLANDIDNLHTELSNLANEEKSDLRMRLELVSQMETVLDRINRTQINDDTSIVGLITGSVGLPVAIIGAIACLDPPITAVCVGGAVVGSVATLFGFGSSIIGRANSVTVGEFKSDLSNIIKRIKDGDVSMKDLRRNINERMSRANMLCKAVQQECM